MIAYYYYLGGEVMKEKKFCGELLKQIHDKMEKHANNMLRSHDLTMSQMNALVELNSSEEKQMSLKDLEKKLHVAQSTAAGIVKRLEQKGFVEGFEDISDKRIKLIRITKIGEECCSNAYQNMIAAEEMLLSDLTEKEQDTFYHLLFKMCNSLK